MSVKKALMAEAYRPLTAWIEAQTAQLGMDRREMLRRVYGVKEGTKQSSHPHNVLEGLRGEVRLTDKTLERMAPVLRLSLDALIAKRNACDERAKANRDQARLDVSQWEPEEPTVLSAGTEVPSSLPPFSMMVASDGRAHIQVNVSGVPIEAAMRILEVLRQENVFRT